MQPNRMLAAAQALLSLGLSPVILDGKKPIFQSFERYEAGPAHPSELTQPEEQRPFRYPAGTLEIWWRERPNANLGILTRDRPGLDFDDPRIFALIADLLPRTPHRKRGRRGFTLIFSRHPTDPVRRTRTFVDRFSKTMLLEILADGRQTVLPPSIHPDTGEEYVWEAIPEWGWFRPEPLSHHVPPPLSQTTVDAIERRLREHGLIKARVERTAGLARAITQAEHARYAAYLKPKFQERLQALREAGAGGRQDALNGMIFALAPWVREGFIDETELEDVARAACEANGWIAIDGDRAFSRQFNKALDEGWNNPIPDLDAGRVSELGVAPTGFTPAPPPRTPPAGHAPGGAPAVIPLPDAVPIPDSSSNIAVNAIAHTAPALISGVIMSAGAAIEIWDDDGTLPPEEPELIRKLLPASPGQLAFIAGKSGMGKSFLAISLAVALALGGEFFGEPVREKVATIIVAGEGAGTLRERLYAAKMAVGCHHALPVSVIPWTGDLKDPAQRLALCEAINQKSHEISTRHGVRVGAVVIDTVSAAFAMDDEGNASEAQSVVNAMREIGRHTGAVVIPIHHVGKDGSKGMRGSSAFFAAADYVLMCGGDYDAESGVYSGRYLAITKSRNSFTGPIGNVSLEIVTIGANQYLEERKTCVFTRSDGEVVTGSSREPKRDSNRIIFDRAYDECQKRNIDRPGASFEELRLQFAQLYPGGGGSGMRMAWGRTWKTAAIDGKYKTEGDDWLRSESRETIASHVTSHPVTPPKT